MTQTLDLRIRAKQTQANHQINEPGVTIAEYAVAKFAVGNR
jgi:hypothetical protein